MKKMLLINFIITILMASNLFAQNEDRITGASLSGDNSVPPVTTSATGTMTGVLTNNWTELHYSITIEGLTPTAAHFHNGAFDATGGVVKALDFTDGMTISGVWSSSDGTQPLTTELLDELLAGRIYVNIHTSANPGGEIRGNIQTFVPFKALLSGAKSVPPVSSSGVGTGFVLLAGSERDLFYGLNVTGLTPTASHFHGGSATGTGGVIKTIDLVNDNAEGDWTGVDAQPLTDSLITELLFGNVYMNVHTSANPGGEIRSQMEQEDATTFIALIKGENHSPPITSIGSGLAFITLDSARTQVNYDITISQITPTAAHFHNAGAGISAGVVKTLDFVDGHASGVWSTSDGTQPLTSLLVEELLSGRLYVNVHTTGNPGGEIRGQVIVISGFNAQLSGSQSVPAVPSSGSGTLTSTFFYTDSGAVLEYDITVEGLTMTASHFHTGAADETGGVVKTITFDGNSAHGVWSANDAQPLTDNIVDMIRSGGIYVNIHTSANPGGEIRGQLLPGIIKVPVGVIDKVREDRIGGASLSGDNSVPPVISSATGTFTGVLTNDWTELHYSITIEGLTPTAAHFHNGAFDATGGVVKALDFTDGMTISGVWSSSDGTQPFTTQMLDELLAGRIYVNIHTSANPGGEIRGNIATVVPFKAMLNGDKSVPPVSSSAAGTGAVLLVGSERVVSYGLNVTGLTPTASHFHGGSATGTGGVIKTIDLVNDNAVAEWLGDDTQPLTDILISDLLLGNVYMNVHTSANPGGEIRSQMEQEDATTFAAFINGGNHSPPISSTGSGLAVLSLNADRTQLEYDITISQITHTAAHFHNAGAGISAGVVKTLDFVDGHARGIWSATDGTQPLTSLLVEELLSGRLYVNIHTSANPGGELRGQVRAFTGYNAQLSGSQTVPAVSSSGFGTLTSTFFYTDSGAVLEYDITVEGLTMTASHFHAGSADETGGVIKTITFDGNSAHGVWSANDAQPLTDDIVDMIRSGGVYVNIHTSANPGGEIRGQLLPGIIEVPVGVIDKVREDRITGAILRGDNSVPPVISSATGTFTGALTNDWTELHYAITIEGLTPTAAHFHNGAFDETGGVVKALDFSGGMTISGVWSSSDGTQPFTTGLLDELLAGRIYVNIHTSANPGGEIRGNIEIPVFFKAMVSGDKIVPDPITSPGVGTGGFLLFGYEREFDYVLNVTGLTTTASHFHGGSATMTGGVLKTINLVNDNTDSNWLGDDAQPLTDSLITELLLGNIYVNIHTSANPGGEIRSQVEREDATSFAAFINGENQLPSNSSISTGMAVMTLSSERTQLEYDITISQLSADSLSAAHFHNAGAGIAGGVVKTLEFVDGHARGIWSATDGAEPLTSVLVEELLSGRLYVNVHTNSFPAGEIRGQIQPFPGFSAQLSGSQSVPAVSSSGTGTFTSMLFYGDSGAELEYDLTVEGLTITASHFHAGAADETGGVIKTITFDGNSATGIWTASDAQPLTDDIVDMIRSGGVYVNIHTSANPGGEIRGQLLPGIIEVPIGVVDQDVAQLPTTVQLKQNYPNPFNPVTSIEYAIPYEDKIVLTIYNILGEEIIRLIDETQPAGNYEITWDAANIASGIYFYKLQSGEFSLTKKMLLLK